MQEVMEQIQKLSLDEQAIIALNIQRSFEDDDEDFTDEEKRELDIRYLEHLNGTDGAAIFEDVRYASFYFCGSGKFG